MENKTKKTQFIKFEGKIIPKPEGIDCELKPGVVYTLHQSRDYDVFLEEDKPFEFPEKYYLSDADNKFIEKVVNMYGITKNLTLGTLLSGMKGSGKTLMAKKIAVASGLPIIVIDKSVDSDEIESFFAKIHDNVCVIMDEIDKYWNTRYLLGFLDGVKPTCKKLVLCTCNNEKEIDEYLNDRCSRIRYKKKFTSLTKDAVLGILSDMIEDKEKAKAATEFIYNHIDVVSYDNVIVFGEEIQCSPEDSYESILADMNIEKH